MKDRLLNRPTTAARTRFKPQEMEILRPQSALVTWSGTRSSGGTGGAGQRPKSGKSASFGVPEGQRGPQIGSVVSVQGDHRRPRVGSAVSSRIVTRSSRSIDRVASAQSTQQSSTREGARSPTPNALRDMEPAFFEIQMFTASFTVWRVEKSSLQIIDEKEIGFFYENNAYLVLRVTNDNVKSLHYWIGQHCCEVDERHVEAKAHELDRILCHPEVFSREVQGHESVPFMRLFDDGIVYIEGKHKTSISRATVYNKRLYDVTGRKYIRASCVAPSKEHLQPESAVILDGFPRVYVWLGERCGYVKRVKAIQIAKKIRQLQRNGKCHIVVIDEKDVALNDAFQKKFEAGREFPGARNIVRNGTQEDENVHGASVNVLHRVSGDRVLYDMPEASRNTLRHRYLVKGDSYLLDRGPTSAVYVWVGSQAMENERTFALKRGKAFSDHRAYSKSSPICRISEGHEPAEFKQCFYDWKDRLSKTDPLTKCYNVGGVGRALCSRSDQRTVAKVNECWSEDFVSDEEGKTEVWAVNEDGLERWDHPGILNNCSCYLLLHHSTCKNSPPTVVYYWLGAKASADLQERTVTLALKKDEEYGHRAVVIRVLDGKEPHHFLSLMQNWIIVYDSDESKGNEDTQLYSVREFAKESVRIQQLPPRWSSLNSSASFVLTTPFSSFLWYGKNSGSQERESTKDLLALLCSSKMYSYEIIPEGKESSAFHKILGAREEYAKDFPGEKLRKRPGRLVCCTSVEASPEFTDIDNFVQEDLSEEEVMILDLYDQLFLWCGERVSQESRQKLPTIAKVYIEQDSARRSLADTGLWFVTQRSEPDAFSKHFHTWSPFEYMGVHAYETVRKKTRQENAKMDVNESMVDISHLGQPKYPYKTLVKKELPNDVDDMHKELHLTDRQFRENVRMSRDQFYRLPVWKQQQILRSTGLFYKPPLPRNTIDLPED